MLVVREVLSAPLDVVPFDSLAAWWRRFGPELAAAASPVEAAFVGGFRGDRLAAVFAAGYQAALRALVPGLPADKIASLCVTEKDGAHPRAIRATLTPCAEGGLEINGEKRWASLSSEADLLLVVVKSGEDTKTGKSLFRVASVDPRRDGVRCLAMPATPFVPEIPHAEVFLERVLVSEDEILPGDGYERYVKPFRTVEDLHVNAAAVGYVLRVVRHYGLDRGFSERLVALFLILRTLSAKDPTDPCAHVALSGVLAMFESILAELDAPFAARAPEEHAMFSRDRALFSVASRARAERTARAWERLAAEK